MVILFYHLFRFFYLGAVRLLSIRNKKAKKWLQGRKNWQQQLRIWRAQNPSNQLIWMHCASQGEFEQGRPVAEALQKNFPHAKLVVSFFSPSGFEAAQKQKLADLYIYLPFDGAANARNFIALLQPSMAILVKYEYWYFYLKTLEKQQITAILISAIFRSNQPFFQWWGGLHRSMLQCFTHVFTQDASSYERLTSLLPKEKITVSGDTRFDRVAGIAAQWQPIPLPDAFCANKKILIAGSTWEADERLLQEWYSNNNKGWKLMLVPHEINDAHLNKIKSLFPEAIFYSQLKQDDPLADASVLVVDAVGMLSKLYRYATVCYIGGGFTRTGIHNMLEAAVYGKPIFSGPEYSKYREAWELKKAGAYLPINNARALFDAINAIDVEIVGKIAADYVASNSGATQIITNWIQEKRLLTNA